MRCAAPAHQGGCTRQTEKGAPPYSHDDLARRRVQIMGIIVLFGCVNGHREKLKVQFTCVFHQGGGRKEELLLLDSAPTIWINKCKYELNWKVNNSGSLMAERISGSLGNSVIVP